MGNDKMREEFEAFAAGHVSLKQYAFDKYPVDGDEYDSIPLQGAWSAWQASREALVIEWPDQHAYTAPDCAGAAILDCRSAFGKAVKVKP